MSDRMIAPDEAEIWLGILLDACFDPTSKTLNLAKSAETLNGKAADLGRSDAVRQTPRIAKSQLLMIAHDFTEYPDDYPPPRQAEMLLRWVNWWVQPEDWSRLQARLRNRRRMARQRQE